MTQQASNASGFRKLLLACGIGAMLFLVGCAAPTKVQPYDYTAFRQAQPKTLLVLPPLNNSLEIKASAAVWANTTRPLAEAGYYVLPVTLVNETLRQNGVTTAHDAHQIAHAKLREYFGADAAVYITVREYGTSYQVIGSDTRVAVEGRLVDLATGTLLWQGSAQASSSEQRNTSQQGIVGLLITAVIEQIVGTVTDAAYGYSAIADERLLNHYRVNGILPGPRLPPVAR